MNSCNFNNKANLRTPKVEIHTRQNYPILLALCCESEAIWSKKFRRIPVTRAGVFVMENFYSGYRGLGRKTEISVTGPARPLTDMNTSPNVAGRDLGNRASPVDQARMERPLVCLACIASVSVGLESKERPRNGTATVFCP